MNDMIFWFVKEDGTVYKLTFIRFSGFGIENYDNYLEVGEKLESLGASGKTISTKLK